MYIYIFLDFFTSLYRCHELEDAIIRGIAPQPAHERNVDGLILAICRHP